LSVLQCDIGFINEMEKRQNKCVTLRKNILYS